MAVTALAPWFGSNRMLGHEVGKLLQGCSWVGIPFAGGMSEIPHIEARTLVVNDLHSHVINLADVVAGPRQNLLKRRLEDLLFHPQTLKRSQYVCGQREQGEQVDPVDWAEAYFVCCWQGRSSKAGTKGEFKNQLALRWESSGGDSAKRYHSAIESLDMWKEQFKRCTFSCLDVFDFLDKCKDRDGHGIYVDAPFPGPGDAYTHTMNWAQRHSMASQLAGYQQTRIVCRWYDTEEIRLLYPESHWTWTLLEGRKQTNAPGPEVLVVRNG